MPYKDINKKREQARRYYHANHERERNARKLVNWKGQGINLTIADYQQLHEKQTGCCAICKRHESEFQKQLAVDHDHVSGKVRGLLCFTCNRYLVQLFEKYRTLLPIVQAYVDGVNQ